MLAKAKARQSMKAKVAKRAAAWAAAERAASASERLDAYSSCHTTEDDELPTLETNVDSAGSENEDDMPSLEDNDADEEGMPALEENATPTGCDEKLARRKPRPPLPLSSPSQPVPIPPKRPPKSHSPVHGLGSGLLGLTASPSLSTAAVDMVSTSPLGNVSSEAGMGTPPNRSPRFFPRSGGRRQPQGKKATPPAQRRSGL